MKKWKKKKTRKKHQVIVPQTVQQTERFSSIKILFESLAALVALLTIFSVVVDFFQIREVKIASEVVLPVWYAKSVESLGTAVDYLDYKAITESQIFEKGCLYDVFLKNSNSKPKTIESWRLDIEEIHESQESYINVFPINVNNLVVV